MSASPESTLTYDLDKVKKALLVVREAPTIHEGLHRAIVDELQCVTSLPAFAARPGSGIEFLARLIGNPAQRDLNHKTLRVIRALSQPQAELVVQEISRLLSLIESEATSGRPPRDAR